MTQATFAPVWTERWELAPADFAHLYAASADRIRHIGYNAYGSEYGETGISISDAIKFSATLYVSNNPGRYFPEDLAEEAETRLAGIMYLLGLVARRTNIDDFTNTLASWERGAATMKRPTQDEALALLAQSADIVSAILPRQ